MLIDMGPALGTTAAMMGGLLVSTTEFSGRTAIVCLVSLLKSKFKYAHTKVACFSLIITKSEISWRY